MRVLSAVLLFALPAFANAQTPADARTSTLPPIGLALPPIGLPLAPIGLAPPGPTPTISERPPARPREQSRHGRQRPGRSGPGVIYVVAAYGWSNASLEAAAAAPAPAAVPAPAAPATGTLHLDLQPPPTGQLFLDGAYVGTLDALGTDLTLAAGTRQVEIRQPGYRPFTLTARIEEGRSLEYRGALEPAAAAAPAAPAAPAAIQPPAAPIARKPLYFIPGCYLGDVPPREAGLPPACDPNKAVTFKP